MLNNFSGTFLLSSFFLLQNERLGNTLKKYRKVSINILNVWLILPLDMALQCLNIFSSYWTLNVRKYPINSSTR